MGAKYHLRFKIEMDKLTDGHNLQLIRCSSGKGTQWKEMLLALPWDQCAAMDKFVLASGIMDTSHHPGDLHHREYLLTTKDNERQEQRQFQCVV